MTRRNLILIHRGSAYEQDFKLISEKVFTLDPRITVYSISAGAHAQVPDGAWQRPTLTVAFQSRFKLNILRGPILTNYRIDKLEQHRIYRAAGIPTPPTMAFEFGMKLDPHVFGEFVVVKPMSLSLTSGGKGIQLFRRKRLEKIVKEEFPNDHPIHSDKKGYLVQRFINTGSRTAWHRVSTLFSKPLYSAYSISNKQIVDLDLPDSIIEGLDITNVIQTDRVQEFSIKQDVLDLAIKVHDTLGKIPLLGIDILREIDSGNLFVLECNPGGNTWHFSSPSGEEWRLRIGGFGKVSATTADKKARKMLINQFGAFDIAARVLAEKTQELAS